MKKNLRVAILGCAGVPGSYGGFETLAHQLVSQLSNRFALTVFCSSLHYRKAQRVKFWNGAKLRYLPIKANGWQSIPYDMLSVLFSIFRNDVLLMLGVSGAICFPFVRWFSSKRLIVHLDGIEWRREKWTGLAKQYLKLAERLAVRYAHTLIADNKGIQDYIKESYGKNSALIEYGGDHARKVFTQKEDLVRYPFLANPYAFKVCRIVPENSVENVLEAFAAHIRHPLVFVGDWNRSDFGRDMRARYAGMKHMHLLDPIYDPVELGLLRSNCFLYIHGHKAGGTNPSLVEAMYLGLPIMAVDVNFNKETTEGQALYFNNKEHLVKLLEETPAAEILEQGQKMKSIADRRYVWSRIAERYSSLMSNVPMEEKVNIESVLSELPELNKTFSVLAQTKFN